MQGLRESEATNPGMHFGASPSLFEKAEWLRQNETKTEKLLWERLKRKQLGVKFRRQHPLSGYIVDFYCHRARLVIEVDGKYHESKEQKALDKIKDSEIEDLNLRIIRISDEEIIADINKVVAKIRKELDSLL